MGYRGLCVCVREREREGVEQENSKQTVKDAKQQICLRGKFRRATTTTAKKEEDKQLNMMRYMTNYSL